MEYKIISQYADDGTEIFMYTQNGRNIPLNSMYSPSKEADRFLKKITHIEKNLVIIIGFGNGILLEKMLESDVYEKAAHFIFIEPFKEITVSEKSNILLRNNKKVSFYYANEFTSLVFASYLSTFNSLPVSIHVHPNYSKVDSAILKDCLKRINEGINTREILNNTEMKFAVDWIVEPLLNLQFVNRSVNLKNLKDRFRGEKAVLIASGPSLKQNMSLIKKLKTSAYTFAVGSALRALLENEISPDFVLSIDSSERNYQTHFRDLQYKGTLIFETMSNSKIQKEHKGNLVVCRALDDHISSLFFSDLYSFPISAPSVAIFGLQVIAYLGFSEVYLVGQDLALIDGKYYAEGIREHEGMKSLCVETWVENNRGEKVGTTQALKIFLESFEKLISTLQNIKIYNLSEFGAKIKGTEFLHPNSVAEYPIRGYIEIDYEKTFNKDFSDLKIQEVIDHFRKLMDETQKASQFIKRLNKIGCVSPKDMSRILKMFKKISKNQLLEKVILSNLTFMFNRIINKFEYFENKERYSNEDLLSLTKELDNFYTLVINYIIDIINDQRIITFLNKE
jgi:hypothetical protein